MTNEFLYTSSGKNDEWFTPDYGVEPLLEFLPPFRNKVIWCPFDTDGSGFCRVLRGAGYEVVNSHISYGQDYFSYEPENWDIMISNPPFTNKREIFRRALRFNKPFALLMTLTWLNDRAPMELFRDKGLQLLMFTSRMKFLNPAAPACQPVKRINFSSAYYCRGFLPEQIIIRDFTEYRQGSLH